VLTPELGDAAIASSLRRLHGPMHQELNARLLRTFNFRSFSVVSKGFRQFFYPSSAIDDDDRRQKRDAIQKSSDFPAQGYVD
jgi:hypothetical protein